MGVASQKNNLLDAKNSGNSPKKVAVKLASIFSERNPGVLLEDVNREFGEKYRMYLFSLCEIWHQMRVHNHTLDAVAQAFAAKLSQMAADKHRLENIIVAQRAELAKQAKYILTIKPNGDGLPRTSRQNPVTDSEHQE